MNKYEKYQLSQGAKAPPPSEKPKNISFDQALRNTYTADYIRQALGIDPVWVGLMRTLERARP